MNIQMVCLANSRKLQERCIAGKEIGSWRWVRPVSASGSGELSTNSIRYADRKLPELLDIIDLTLRGPDPKPHQPENYLIDQGKPLRFVGKFPSAEIKCLCDEPANLWDFTGGDQDRVSYKSFLKQVNTSSLLFIKPSKAKIIVGQNVKGVKRLRLHFEYKKGKYNWAITDIQAESKYLERNIGHEETLDENQTYLCLSVGEPYQGYCYKLVAAILSIPSVAERDRC